MYLALLEEEIHICMIKNRLHIFVQWVQRLMILSTTPSVVGRLGKVNSQFLTELVHLKMKLVRI